MQCTGSWLDIVCEPKLDVPLVLTQVLTVQRHWHSEQGPQYAGRAVHMLQGMSARVTQLLGMPVFTHFPQKKPCKFLPTTCFLLGCDLPLSSDCPELAPAAQDLLAG